MVKMVPLISTRCTGPLGLVHLPRVWQKMLLASRDQLADGYRSGEGGFDGFVLDALGIDLKDAAEYISSDQPTYLAFEGWVRAQADAGRLTPEAIASVNEQILGFPMPDPRRTELLQGVGLSADEDIHAGADINDLDDWAGFHRALCGD